ncbi:MAG: ankyrin repeat domain-containing protein [Candidatus Babeliales bacterium]
MYTLKNIFSLFVIAFLLQVINTANAMHQALTPLDKQLFKAAKQDDAQEVERLLNAGANKEAYSFLDGTPLMAAALRGSTKAMRVLLDAGANKNARCSTGKTALHSAIITDKALAVRMLIDEHADLEATDRFDHTPLIKELNTFASDETILDMLLDAGANVHVKTRDCNTLLHLAAHHVRPNAITVLLGKGLPINAKNDAGKTPLHKAALYLQDSAATVATLIEAGADMNTPDKSGSTPLNRALNEYNTQRVQSHFKHSILMSLKALLTSATPQEVQHVIPAIITLTSKSRGEQGLLPLPAEIGHRIAVELIPEIVKEKLALAKKYLPQYNEAQLRQEIIQSINRVIQKSPYIAAATNSKASPAATDHT